MTAGAPPTAAAPSRVTLPRGATVRYWRLGAGTPLVFLHSMLPPAGDDPFATALAEHFEVLLPVAPGFEDLDELADLDDVHDLAIHYDDLLRALGRDRVAVVGHSFGGMVAAELAAHFPERVASLVLVSPFGLWDEEHPTVDLATISGPGLRARLAGGDEALVPGPAGDDPDTRVEDAVRLSQAMTSTVKFLWPFPDQGLLKRIHRVSCDTLVVWGDEDDINPPAYADGFAAAIPGSRVELLGGHHLLPYEHPGRVATLVRDFVTERK